MCTRAAYMCAFGGQICGGQTLHIPGTLRSVSSTNHQPAARAVGLSAAMRRVLSVCSALICLVACSPNALAPIAAPPAVAVAKPSAAPAAQPTAASKPAAATPASGEIVVFAASSLTDAFQDMATAFQLANPDARLIFNFGASTQLATQLEQ